MNIHKDSVKKTFTQHLFELRSRLIHIIIIYFVAFCISYYFSEKIYFFAAYPLIEVIGDKTHFIYTGLAEAFFAHLNLASKFAFVLILPAVIFHLYRFIEPALYKDEKILVRMLAISSPILFFSGMVFVYYFVLPKAFEFFINFQQNSPAYSLNLEAKINEYISLFTSLLLSFGIAFQLPIFILVFISMNLLEAKNLKDKRRFAILLIFIIAGIITPPDVVSQLLLAFPLMGLYEITIIIAMRLESRRKNYA